MSETCCQRDCEQPATKIVSWLGQPKLMCDAHAAKAADVAAAMGFRVSTESVPAAGSAS